jgi:glycosyltransferase involved in cell wall biosynthesis
VKRLAYLLGTFPALTETFIQGEIEALAAAGQPPALFALCRSRGHLDLGKRDDLVERTHYGASFTSPALWRANAAAFRRAPGRYLRVLGSILGRTLLNPVVCMKSLGIFPVAVEFAERMRERGIEHVHAHWANFPATAAYIVSRLLGIPFSVTAHNYDATLIRALFREKMRRASFIVTCNRWNAQRIIDLVPEAHAKVIVNYHGAVLDRFAPDRAATRTGDTMHIVSCGSLYPRKGFPVLLEACRRLRDRGHAFQCTIIGEGPMRRRLQRFVDRHRLGDCVRLIGAQPHAGVVEHYRRADLFVLACITDYLGLEDIVVEPLLLLQVGPAIPFRPLTDGIPNVIAEAMAMELPVISTYVAGIPELVQDGRNGLLVPEKDPDALVTAMERLMADAQMRRRLGERARETVLEMWDRRKNIRELLTLFVDGTHANGHANGAPAGGAHATGRPHTTSEAADATR